MDQDRCCVLLRTAPDSLCDATERIHAFHDSIPTVLFVFNSFSLPPLPAILSSLSKFNKRTMKNICYTSTLERYHLLSVSCSRTLASKQCANMRMPCASSHTLPETRTKTLYSSVCVFDAFHFKTTATNGFFCQSRTMSPMRVG